VSGCDSVHMNVLNYYSAYQQLTSKHVCLFCLTGNVSDHNVQKEAVCEEASPPSKQAHLGMLN